MDYVTWVKQYYDVDTANKRLTRRVAQGSASAASGGGTAPVACSHSKTTRKGSSARYIRISCVDCGAIISNTERDEPTVSVYTCQHKRTDHRGSNKHVLRTYCKDCGMVIEEIPRSLVAQNEGLSPDEQMLIDCMNEHDKMSKNQVCSAAQLMSGEAQHLAEGEYTTTAIIKMFFDCIDRTLTITPASSAAARASPAGQEVLKRNFLCKVLFNEFNS